MPITQTTSQTNKPGQQEQNKNINYNASANNTQNKKSFSKNEEGAVNKKHILSDSDSLSSSEDSGKNNK